MRKKIGQRVCLRQGKEISLKERHEMICQYLSGKYSQRAVWTQHTGQEKEDGQILTWMRKYGYLSPCKKKTVQLSNQKRHQVT